MTENIVYWYTEDDVFEALRERIFTKEVRELFGDADEFRLMVQAFAELTHTEEIIVFGKIYYQNELRRILCDELDSSTVIDAYELFKNQYHSKGAKLLAWLILREHLTQDELVGLMVEYDLGRGAWMYFGSQKREPCKNFYMVPNEIMRLGLSVGEIAVYNYLMYCEDHKTYQCYPSYRKMGEALGLTRKTVMKYVRSLEEKCLITTEHTTITLKSGKKQNGNLLYTIRPIKEAVDYFYAQQLRKAERETAKLNAIRKLEEYDRKHGISDTSRSSLFEAG